MMFSFWKKKELPPDHPSKIIFTKILPVNGVSAHFKDDKNPNETIINKIHFVVFQLYENNFMINKPILALEFEGYTDLNDSSLWESDRFIGIFDDDGNEFDLSKFFIHEN